MTSEASHERGAMTVPETIDLTDGALAPADAAARALDALRASEHRYRTLVRNAPIGYLIAAADGTVLEANDAACALFGVPPAAARTLQPFQYCHPDDKGDLEQVLAELLDGSVDTCQLEHRVIGADGVEHAVATTIARVDGVAPDAETGDNPEHYLVLLRDISQRAEAERALELAQEQTARLARIVETTSDLVGISDHPSGRLTYLNAAARRRFGLDEHEPIDDLTLGDLYTEDSVVRFTDEILGVLDAGDAWNGELRMIGRDGDAIEVWQTITAERDDAGAIVGLAAVGRDVTERRRMETELAYAATHDPLTGLPNRALLIDHLELALAQASRSDDTVAVLFLDLDRFKLVNDSHGHDAGDALLRAVASRIAGVLRPGDTVARLGGDEFVVLCAAVRDEFHALAIAQRVAACIEGASFDLGEIDLELTASIGVALATHHETHPEALLRGADAAMYRAKDHGRARIELFDESMRRRASERAQLAEELAHAVEHDEIRVLYQPVIDPHSGRVTSVEALARWAHPTRGELTPKDFIGLAEDTGLIVGLGLRVLHLACTQAAAWVEAVGDRAPIVHVNLSATQLGAANLADLVAAVVERAGLRPELLCLEITETVVMEDAEAAISTLDRLCKLGVGLAIDDFGTGYSSLSYLRRLPVDTLKIDQSFVDGLGPDPEDSSIVAAIISLARTLELGTIAEGVETAEQLVLLAGLGCTGAQGFLIAEPVPAEALEASLRTGVDLGALGVVDR